MRAGNATVHLKARERLLATLVAVDALWLLTLAHDGRTPVLSFAPLDGTAPTSTRVDLGAVGIPGLCSLTFLADAHSSSGRVVALGTTHAVALAVAPRFWTTPFWRAVADMQAAADHTLCSTAEVLRGQRAVASVATAAALAEPLPLATDPAALLKCAHALLPLRRFVARVLGDCSSNCPPAGAATAVLSACASLARFLVGVTNLCAFVTRKPNDPAVAALAPVIDKLVSAHTILAETDGSALIAAEYLQQQQQQDSNVAALLDLTAPDTARTYALFLLSTDRARLASECCSRCGHGDPASTFVGAVAGLQASASSPAPPATLPELLQAATHFLATADPATHAPFFEQFRAATTSILPPTDSDPEADEQRPAVRTAARVFRLLRRARWFADHTPPVADALVALLDALGPQPSDAALVTALVAALAPRAPTHAAQLWDRAPLAPRAREQALRRVLAPRPRPPAPACTTAFAATRAFASPAFAPLAAGVLETLVSETEARATAEAASAALLHIHVRTARRRAAAAEAFRLHALVRAVHPQTRPTLLRRAALLGRCAVLLRAAPARFRWFVARPCPAAGEAGEAVVALERVVRMACVARGRVTLATETEDVVEDEDGVCAGLLRAGMLQSAFLLCAATHSAWDAFWARCREACNGDAPAIELPEGAVDIADAVQLFRQHAQVLGQPVPDDI